MHPFVGLRQPGAEAERLTSFGSHRDGLVHLNDQGPQVSGMGYVLQKLISTRGSQISPSNLTTLSTCYGKKV